VVAEIYGNGVLDYACQYTGIDDQSFMPPLVARERGQITIKLLKLHGSLNWVTCPKCQRLFVNQDKKDAMWAFEGKITCRFCDGVKLNAALLLPSFKKDFDKFHFQSIWHQAGIELSEATKLVFMGYSFPVADYDFRSLITKHVGDVQVDVVLKSQGGEETEDGRRYMNYFGNKINRIHYDGVENYIQHHLEI
jgi:NAD-dependent SIR2 family protein deacetylase